MATHLLRLTFFSAVFFGLFSSSPSQPPSPSLAPSRPNLTSPPIIMPPWPSAQSTSAAPSPSPHGASSAALIFRSRGYSLMARILEFAMADGGNLNGWNGSGTIFAPSDSAFRNGRRRHQSLVPRASTSILLYHTAQLPALLMANLASLPAGSSIPTFSRRRCCIFLRQMSTTGEICLAENPSAKPCFRIRNPDLFHDGNLTVHGIDGVLDPSEAFPCQLNTKKKRAPHVDAVVTALRHKGFSAVADAMEARRSDLERLPAVTLFAPRDGDLRQGPDRFREDLDQHVVPRRYHLKDLARFSQGPRIGTIAANKDIAVGSRPDGSVTLNGVPVDGGAVYRSRWAVVLPIRRQLGLFDELTNKVPTASAASPPAPPDHGVESIEFGPSWPTESTVGETASAVKEPFDGDDVALASSSGSPECSNCWTADAACDEVPPDVFPPRVVDPKLALPDGWCLMSNERQVAPCSRWSRPAATPSSRLSSVSHRPDF